jgi:pimeloyl-ACP methyl ester carboxylesterase
VRALLGCLDELGVTEPATIGAHSLGALIAIRLAAMHPDRVRSVVAFGPPMYPDRQSALAHVGATSPMARLFVLPGPSAEIACRWVCNHHDLSVRLALLTHPGLPPRIASDALQHTWESYSETLERSILASEAPTWLPHVRSQLRLIAGDHDPVVDSDFLARVPSIARHATVESWAGGHDLPLARPTDCVTAIEHAAAQASSVS